MAALLCCASAASHAESSADDDVTPGGNGTSVQFARIDVPARALAGSSISGAGPSLQSVSISDVSYRWWVTRGRTDWGLGFGALSISGQPAGNGLGAEPVFLKSAATVSVGMRYRTSSQATVFADASGGDAYVGKVGVEWKPASLASRWNLTYGGIGWRLSSDSRMTLRVKSGGVGLYMRSQF